MCKIMNSVALKKQRLNEVEVEGREGRLVQLERNAQQGQSEGERRERPRGFGDIQSHLVVCSVGSHAHPAPTSTNKPPSPSSPVGAHPASLHSHLYYFYTSVWVYCLLHLSPLLHSPFASFRHNTFSLIYIVSRVSLRSLDESIAIEQCKCFFNEIILQSKENKLS